MDKKKILIVSASFYPKNSPRSFRTTELVKEFYRQGHEVVISIPDTGFDYSEFLKETPVSLKYYGKLRYRAIAIKGNSLIKKLRRLARRMFGLLLEYPGIEHMYRISSFLKQESGYDLLISIAVPFPVHWGVARVRSRKHPIATTWVADCGDPYMLATTDSFRKPFYFKYVEKKFCRKCDSLSVPFESLKNHFYKEFRSKMVVIPQGFNTREIRVAKKVENPIPTFAFAGAVIPGIRDFNLFFSFLKQVETPFRFIVFSEQPDYYAPFKAHFKERLEVRGYLPRLELLYELSTCDFVVNVDTKFDCVSNTTAFPSKLIDYSFTTRPILNLCSNKIDESKVRQFLAGDYQGRRQVDSEQYKIENVTAKFLQLAP